MEFAPPSYADATSHDHWNIIAPYITSGDLCSATLVCSRWHEIFSAHLWGNPASHFGTEDDAVYVALTRFKRTLPRARLFVRQMTHTLHLPPAHAELYQGPHADWLLTVLNRLPNLQCLIVDQLPFFDHAALLYLRRAVTTVGGSSIGPSQFRLRLLNASGCANATYTGLAESLLHLPSLVHLNLSYTHAARHSSVLGNLSLLNSLQVLELRATGLIDSDMELIGQQAGLRLRSLDVRDNFITDRGANTLLRSCFLLAAPQDSGQGAPSSEIDSQGRFLGQYQGLDLGQIVRNRLATGVSDVLAIERGGTAGLTHLFISGNKLTEYAVAGLLMNTNIQALDAGDLISLHKPPDYASVEQGPSSQAGDLLASGTLLPLLTKHCSSSLRYLRIHHSIVTGKINWTSHKQELAEIGAHVDNGPHQDARELDSMPLALSTELEASGPTELAAEPVPTSSAGASTHPAIAELPGDAPSPTFVRALANAHLEWKDTEKSGPAQAPDPPDIVVDDEFVVESASHTLVNPSPAHSVGALSVSDATSDAPSSSSRARSYSATVQKRDEFIKGQKSTSPFLSPASLPRIQTLVLTGVPERASSPLVEERLIELVKCCAAMATLAKEEAGASYARPPGRTKRAFERDYIRSIMALERIVIEIAVPGEPGSAKAASRRRGGKSTTEDADSEAFWTAAEDDFTFFNDDECGLPVEQPHDQFYMSDKIAVGEEEQTQAQSASKRRASMPAAESTYDVAGRLAVFRRERKQRYDRAVATGLRNPSIEGYWEGLVQVKRPYLENDAANPRDFYGNSFEKGYLYR